jgi:hypothetical protein
MRFAHERSAREALSLEVARLRGSAPAPSVEAPPAEAVIDLRLILPRGAGAHMKTCAVTVRTWSGGQVVWTRGGLQVSTFDGRRGVVARLTGDVLTAGSYEILLTGTADTGQSIDIAAYEVTIGERH